MVRMMSRDFLQLQWRREASEKGTWDGEGCLANKPPMSVLSCKSASRAENQVILKFHRSVDLLPSQRLLSAYHRLTQQA